MHSPDSMHHHHIEKLKRLVQLYRKGKRLPLLCRDLIWQKWQELVLQTELVAYQMMLGSRYSGPYRHAMQPRPASCHSLEISRRAPLKNVTICGLTSRVAVSNVQFRTAESLSIGNILKYKVPMEPWLKLRELVFDNMSLSTQSRVSYVVTMIMNSPNLQRLAIRMDGTSHPVDEDSGDEALDVTGLGDAGSKCEKIAKVEVKRIRGTEHEMKLISWLLNSTPALDDMRIQLSDALSDAEKMLVVIELNRLRRASSRARIDIN